MRLLKDRLTADNLTDLKPLVVRLIKSHGFSAGEIDTAVFHAVGYKNNDVVKRLLLTGKVSRGAINRSLVLAKQVNNSIGKNLLLSRALFYEKKTYSLKL
jgi:hypothetical protein